MVEKWHKSDLSPAYLVKRQNNNQPTTKKSNNTTRVTVYNDESIGLWSRVQAVKNTTDTNDRISDSGSTITLAKNEKSIRNLRPCKNRVIISTNAGEERIVEEGGYKE